MARKRRYLDDVHPRVVARSDATSTYTNNINQRMINGMPIRQGTKYYYDDLANQQNAKDKEALRRRVNTRGTDTTNQERNKLQAVANKRKVMAKKYTKISGLEDRERPIPKVKQAQLYNKDKVNLAKAQQAFYRDAAANIGVDWGNKLNPYTQRDLIANAAKSFGVTNATPYTLPLFASFTPGMAARTFMGSAIGGEVGGLVGSQVATAASDKPWAPLVGGLAGGFIGGGIGSYVPNKNYIRLANALNNNIQNAKVNLSYIRPDFNRFKLGDVEINNPSLYYRQGSTSMGEDFLNTGIVREGGGYANPMFARGKLWYGIPTKEMLTQGRQLKVGRFTLTKANEVSPKTDLLVSTGEMVPSDAKAMPKHFIHTKKRLHPYSKVDIKNAKTNSMRDFMLEFNDKYYNGELDDLANITHVDEELIRRIPVGKTSANKGNTTLYRYDPGYGYRKIRQNPIFVQAPFEKPLVDIQGNLTTSIDDIFENLQRRVPFGRNIKNKIN